jgi:hypothetical protein
MIVHLWYLVGAIFALEHFLEDLEVVRDVKGVL